MSMNFIFMFSPPDVWMLGALTPSPHPGCHPAETNKKDTISSNERSYNAPENIELNEPLISCVQLTLCLR